MQGDVSTFTGNVLIFAGVVQDVYRDVYCYFLFLTLKFLRKNICFGFFYLNFAFCWNSVAELLEQTGWFYKFVICFGAGFVFLIKKEELNLKILNKTGVLLKVLSILTINIKLIISVTEKLKYS